MAGDSPSIVFLLPGFAVEGGPPMAERGTNSRETVNRLSTFTGRGNLKFKLLGGLARGRGGGVADSRPLRRAGAW